MNLYLLFAGLLYISSLRATELPDIEDGFEEVTCGSVIKLANKMTEHKLHSHSVTYGTGSMQQSVTGFAASDDANSYWTVEAGSDKVCTRGIPCGSIIRLKHVNTQCYLHSHFESSPLSHQQEVSCYDGQDSGDNWKLDCRVDSSNNKNVWLRERPVQFIHEDTKTFLSSSSNYRFGQPIPGQLEVAASRTASKNTQWLAQEGIYFAVKRI
ncbi:MIR motif-containing protein [Mycotypha africana]|uniref:MIR motif-containing protein n=1 Tax=Mycotypha africana TaxID=64632 RepID=UPI0023000529|nr:MIR motif-containing protein [Mycotypha africana]KAI8987514.1 MIR motif-containing protein [Mycotypha africana]